MNNTIWKCGDFIVVKAKIIVVKVKVTELDKLFGKLFSHNRCCYGVMFLNYMATGNPFVNIYVQVTGFSCEFKKKSLNILNSRRDRNTVHFRKKYWKIFIRSRHFAGK